MKCSFHDLLGSRHILSSATGKCGIVHISKALYGYLEDDAVHRNLPASLEFYISKQVPQRSLPPHRYWLLLALHEMMNVLHVLTKEVYQQQLNYLIRQV
jgi:hypothetical protein